MSTKSFWCAVCNRMVAAVIEEGASAIAAPLLLGGAAGGAIGRAKGGWEGAVGGALIGLLVGAAARALVPPAQKVLCHACGGHVG
jgi:outer membrane lipoprotein SlyB